MSFKVCDKPCNQCLFSKEKIVSDARRKEILGELARNDSHFICHKTDNVACAGDFNRNPARTNLMRIMGRLGAIERVKVGE